MCPVTFSKFTCIPERPGGRSGPGRSERAWPSSGLGTQRPRVRAGPQYGPWGSAGGHRDSAGHWSGVDLAPNVAPAWHRRAARRVHANGRRARYELFSSGAERTSAARRAAWSARPPPLQSGRTDFPNFPRPAPRMRPPRRRGPRPSALAALPPLPPILCLLSRSWHLSQRARFPAHPFTAGSGRGRGHRGPGRRGRGKRGALCVLGRPPGGGGGRAQAPGHPCSARRSGLRTRPEYQRGRRARCGPVRPGAAPPGQPPPGRARSGWAGSGSYGFAAPALLLAPQLRVRAPAGTPPRALPACACPPRGPARRPRASTPQGTAQRRPTHRAPKPTQRGGLNRSASPDRGARAALARRRLPGRAPRLCSKAPAAMIAGSTRTRAHAQGRLGPSVDSSPVCLQQSSAR